MKWDNSFNGIEYYSNVKSSSVEWIWYPYIPCGKITVLQGDPGEGKSTLILHIAAILTKGANLPDGNKIKKPMTVIYQCSEDSKADTIKPRLENAGADCRRVAFIKDDNGDLTLDDERIELAVKTTGAKLLILDPIQAFIGKNGNMQSAVRMRETMTKLANIAEEYACAIVLVGHMTKSNSGKSIYRGLGSIDIAAAARSVLLVARDKDEPSKRYMLPIKSSLAPEGEPIAFALDRDNGFSWIGKCEININELAVGQRVSAKKDIAINYLHAVKWGTIRNGKWAVLPKSCRGFSEPLFELMDWNNECKYRFRGQYSKEDNEQILLFDLEEPEVIKHEVIQEDLPDTNTTEAEENTVETSENKTKKIVRILFPKQWQNHFGYRSEEVVLLHRVKYCGNWDVLRPAKIVEGLEPISENLLDKLNEEAQNMIEKMRCAV